MMTSTPIHPAPFLADSDSAVGIPSPRLYLCFSASTVRRSVTPPPTSPVLSSSSQSSATRSPLFPQSSPTPAAVVELQQDRSSSISKELKIDSLAQLPCSSPPPPPSPPPPQKVESPIASLPDQLSFVDESRGSAGSRVLELKQEQRPNSKAGIQTGATSSSKAG
ncbi:unnamed protein product [Linum trigynum]|uniref:Uncharacterized protein n=1 Tax=Linum trigynum TaxID=586398 RepID=A0AAV2EVF0_9ROSI